MNLAMETEQVPPPGPGGDTRILNAMTVDVEEHFQVSAFEKTVRRSEWPDHPSRVVSNTDRLLSLFEETGIHATFFVLGWVAERHPDLVRRILACGHDIGSHGYSHQLIYTQKRETFRQETDRSKKFLEDVTGTEVEGYRAASFSIVPASAWALDVLAECGFRYDSSLFPVVHDRYGFRGIPRRPFRVRTRSGACLDEIPLSTIVKGRFTLPVAGGGYLRLYPWRLTRWAVTRLNRAERIPANVYTHPWEVDPAQPRIGNVPMRSRFRHYVNLDTTLDKLDNLIGMFRFGTLRRTLEEYGELEEVEVAPSGS